ncbi:peptidylprolyl isomerase [uncultured Lacinutrix sp.]|uniref:peptidylprolyl isomerase n=1 Tax=uncultured Lacinutrix sp. TaxID=574032 RepID=UPI002617FEEB|nr:peptidylprolyl isomerase [uncultured Lacinutrix sp.]
MNLKTLVGLFSLFFITIFSLNAQEKDIIFTIDGNPVYASEFSRVYNKNLDLVKEEAQKDIDGYLKLFIDYKLKLQEAKALGLDKKPSYIREYESYKNQLSRNYLNDTKVTDALVEEAYNRLKEEVNASHILIRVNQNANPNDTLVAYNEMLKLRDRVLKEGYKAVQKEVHNGKTIYAEDLGYFSTFKMVYDFENAAYNTAVGDVSMPFRTRFGYHIVKVIDKRASQGKVTAAHIMIKGDEEKIKDIYKRLEQGEVFEALAKQFSEDKSSASNGGLLKPFSGGELSSTEFEKEAFGLIKKGSYSKPFKSQFGWHIVKLIEKKPLASFEDMKSQLQSKIKRDSRSQLINDSRINNLKAKYNIVENPNALDYFKSIITKDFISGKWSIPKDLQGDKKLFSINDKSFIYKDFAQHLSKSQRRKSGIKSLNTIVENSYETYMNSELLKFQEENLINENEEYAQIAGEYRDGLLLFDLMETEIWNAAKSDSIGVKDYYNKNKKDYFFNERVDAIVGSSAKKKNIKKVAKLLEKGKTVEEIKTILNTNNEVNVSFTTSEMDKKHQALPEGFKFKKGVSKIYNHNNAFVVVKVKTILPKAEKTFEEAKGKVISDFQTAKEKTWLKTLASKYKIELNQDVLNKVKEQIKNQ